MRHILSILIAILATSSLAETSLPSVIFVTSYSADNPWSLAIVKSITGHLEESKLPIQARTYHLQDDNPDMVVTQIHSTRPRLTVMIDDEAANALISRIGDTFPIIATGINQRRQDITWLNRNNISVVSEEFSIQPILNAFSQTGRPMTRWMIIGPRNYSSNLVAKSIQSQSQSARIEYKTQLSNNFDDWKSSIDAINQSDGAWVLLPFGLRSPDGQVVPPKDVSENFSKKVTIPTFGPGNALRPIPRLMTISANPKNLGKQTAEQIFRFLNGESLEDIGYESFKYPGLQINYAEAKRIGIEIPRKLFDFVQEGS